MLLACGLAALEAFFSFWLIKPVATAATRPSCTAALKW